MHKQNAPSATKTKGKLVKGYAARAMGFFSQRRGLFPVRKNHLVKISADDEKWVREQVQSDQGPPLEDPEERRDKFRAPSGRSGRSPRPAIGLQPQTRQSRPGGGGLRSAHYATTQRPTPNRLEDLHLGPPRWISSTLLFSRLSTTWPTESVWRWQPESP